MQAAIFLDRDDTLIHNSGDLGDPDAVRLIQGAAVAIGSLRGLGYKIVVVTNQGGVARGKYGEADVDAVHERINEIVHATASGASIDRFYYCPYHPQGTVERYTREHPWRKPQPGMLLQAARDMQLDLSQCWMIGDQMRDVEAGAAAGARTILLSRDGRIADAGEVQPHFVARSLVEAVRIIAQQRKPEVADEIRQDELASRRWITAAPARREMSPPDSSATPQPPEDRETSEPSQPSESADPVKVEEPAPPKPPATREPPESPQPPDSPEHAAPAAPAAPKPVRTTRPFIPWTNQPVEAPAGSPTATSSSAQGTATASPRPTRSAPAGTASPRKSGGSEPAGRRVEPIVPGPEAPPKEEPAAEHSAGIPSAASIHATLRQMLQELRNQRGNVQEFSALGYLAIVLQVVAAVCLIAAFMMGPHEEGSFNQWLGCAIYIQLTVISVLLFDR